MLHRLVLGGSLVILLTTSSLAKIPAGSHCRLDLQCVSGNCQNGTCQRQRRKYPSGSPCRRNVQCASGNCSGRRGLRVCR
jgi:hypothetical protein